jgi:hypothetical protein
MKSKFYEKPVMEVTSFDNSDVITLSAVNSPVGGVNDLDKSNNVISVANKGKWNK